MRKAGMAIMDIYGEGINPDYKEDGSPVTLADRRSEEILVTGLRKIAPKIPIISEENAESHKLKDNREYFLVDPLDGTKEFLEFDGKGNFTVNIGLISNGEPIMGIIYAPVRAEMFFGISSFGSFIEEESAQAQSIKVRTDRRGPTIAVASKKHSSYRTSAWLSKKSITKIISASSSIKFCSVAKGDADVYPRFAPTMEWDTAAGHAILLGAGGLVTLSDEKTILRYGKNNYRNGDFIAWGGVRV